MDPKLAKAHTNLGAILLNQGKAVDAIAASHKAIELDPRDVLAHNNLGRAFLSQGKVPEAVAAFHKAIALDPESATARYNLGNTLLAQGKRDEAIAAYRKAIDHAPNFAQAHGNLAGVLLLQGKGAEACSEYRKALALFARDGRARRELALAHVGLGTILEVEGKREEAIAEFRQAIALNPQDALAPRPRATLAEALLQQGRFAEARASADTCLELAPPRHPLRAVAGRLRRSCDRMLALEPKLPEVLAGKIQPAGAERLPYAYLCSLKKLHAGAARLFADGFATEARLAADLKAQHRYTAACCAARAGCGQGEDAAKLDDPERARWRKQALEWLAADLAAYGKLLEDGAPANRALVQQRLRHWRQDRDLHTIRDSAAVENLPAAERQARRKLWAEVERLLRQARG
jgi:tetratricopeptide (TPR) repeat protein